MFKKRTAKENVEAMHVLQACLKEEAGVDWAPKRVQGLLAALDIDGDGKVQKEELVQSVQVLSKVLDSLVANKTTATASLDELLMTLHRMELGAEVREKHQGELDTLTHELKINSEQLKAVGNDPVKLTVQYQQKWDENRAALVSLPHKAVQLAKKHGELHSINYFDKLTLLASKEFYGLLIELANGTAGLCVLWASADMDFFKLINDGWSHAHGDFAIILTGLTISKAVGAWNEKHRADQARCIAFRMGGDEVRALCTRAFARHAQCV